MFLGRDYKDFFRHKDSKARRKEEKMKVPICSKRRNWMDFYFSFFTRTRTGGKTEEFFATHYAHATDF